MNQVNLKKSIAAFCLLPLVGSCSSLGSSPDKVEQEDFKSSPQFDPLTRKFQNRLPKVHQDMKKNFNFWSMLKHWINGSEQREPSSKLPQEKPNLEDFLKPSEHIKTIWLGHSTILLNLGGKVILIDPVFSSSASPVSFLVKRFQAPALAMEELPAIDFVLISHDHYDHLDRDSIVFLGKTQATFITPLGVGSHLKGWGIDEKRIVEKDWWQSAPFDGIRFTATPAQHFSGRKGLDENCTLWASWVITSGEHNVYFSGDSGYDTHFKEIGARLGPFDVAFIESGQYNETWEAVHMLPEQAIQAFQDLKAKQYFPIHWGMFTLSFHSWYEPIERISALAKKKKIHLVSPKLGEIVDHGQDQQHSEWWVIAKKLAYQMMVKEDPEKLAETAAATNMGVSKNRKFHE